MSSDFHRGKQNSITLIASSKNFEILFLSIIISTAVFKYRKSMLYELERFRHDFVANDIQFKKYTQNVKAYQTSSPIQKRKYINVLSQESLGHKFEIICHLPPHHYYFRIIKYKKS